MKYGLPYKGSKNTIAKKIIDFLPGAANFYDLFAGGCAITHCAMLAGKWQNHIINDIEPGIVQLFKDAVDGRYRHENRWISRDMFNLLKDSDPYVRYCWSFGNNGEAYMYAPEVERFKKHLHNMFFSTAPKEARLHWKSFVREFQIVRDEIRKLTEQVEALCTECGVELLRDKSGMIDAKRIKDSVFKVLSGDIREYMRNALKESGHTAADVDKLLGTSGMAGHYFGASQWALPTEEAYKKMQELIPQLVIPWGTLHESLQSLQSLQRLESYSQSYDTIEIKPDSIIYCDIPYKDTDGYSTEFNHEAFYDWACQQDVPIFISEYWMPEDRFECVLEVNKRSKLSATANNAVIEKLFIPKK